MITDKGTIKVSTPITEQTQKELNGTTKKLSILYLILGPVFLVLGAVFIFVLEENAIGNCFLLLGFVLLVLSIFLLLVVSKAIKSVKQYQKVEDTEFLNSYMLVRDYTDGEHIATVKIYYKWVVRIKETPNYLFIYNSRVTAVAIFKGSLSVQELTAVRNLIGKAMKGGETFGRQPYNGTTGANMGGDINAAGNFGANGSTVTPPWESVDIPAGGSGPSDPFADLRSSEESNGSGSVDGSINTGDSDSNA